jgi:hypothetical protein
MKAQYAQTLSNNQEIHIWICLALFVICLAFPGFYVGLEREPNLAYSLLMLGWLGPLDGHLAWFANPLLLAALIKRNSYKTSFVLAVIALALALSFLAYERIIVSEAPSYKPIVAYGWGYFLWLASIGYFATVQYSLATNRTARFRVAVSTAWLLGCLAISSVHYFVGENSQFAIASNRNAVFQEKCRVAGQTILRQAGDTNGIFLDPDGVASFKKTDSGDWYNDGIGVFGLGLLNSRLVLFYETRNHRSDKEGTANAPFRRFDKPDFRGIEVHSLESRYAMVTKAFDIPRPLNMYGAEVTIKDLKDDSILAKTTYIFDQANRRFCGHAPNGRFSTAGFVHETLQLSKK